MNNGTQNTENQDQFDATEHSCVQAVRAFFRLLKLLYATQPTQSESMPLAYSSAKDGILPPGVASHRQFVERCRSGDLKDIAVKDGKIWFVEAFSYMRRIVRTHRGEEDPIVPEASRYTASYLAEHYRKESIEKAFARTSKKQRGAR